MKHKHKKVDKLAMRLTADRVISGKSNAGQFEYFRGLMDKVRAERDEQVQKEDDSAEEESNNSLPDEKV